MSITITFLRHGNTAKAAVDMDRQLTEKGVEQSMARRQALGNPSYDLIVSSVAPRAMHTAELVAGGRKVDVTCEELYFGILPKDEFDLMNEAFAKLAYSPLVAYYAEEGVRTVLDHYTSSAAQVIRSAIAQSGAKRVLVAGHAVFIPALALAMGGEPSIAELNLGEAETITVTL